MAIKTSPNTEKNVVDYLNSHSTITHNYKRDAEYNIWFTYAYKTDSEKSDLIRELQTQFDINHLIELPSIKTYKLKTDFSLEEINLENLPSVHGLPEPAEPLIDIPITPMPFQQIGESMGIAEEDVILEIMQGMESGHIRRFGAILNHTKAGMTSNSLIVWKIPQDKVDTIGEIFAGQPFISHCYQRTPQPDWPYNLYTMLHARSLAEENKFIDQLKGEVKSHDLDHEYKRLDTIQEFKKTSFVPYDAGSSLSGKIRLR